MHTVGKKWLVKEREEEILTTSLRVALFFNKQHKHVLEVIRNTIADIGDIESRGLNLGRELLIDQPKFQEVSLKDGRGKKQPAYLLNRDAFMLLVMSFSGKQAMKIKLKFITAFNKAERLLTGEALAEIQIPFEFQKLSADNLEIFKKREHLLSVLAGVAKSKLSIAVQRRFLVHNVSYLLNGWLAEALLYMEAAAMCDTTKYIFNISDDEPHSTSIFQLPLSSKHLVNHV